VRDPAKLPWDVRRQVELVRGSSDDAATLRWALADIDSVFWCVPPESARTTDVVMHYARFARAAAAAIAEARTPRVVTVSADGGDAARLPNPIGGLRAMEDILNQSGASLRHLRCGWLMDNLLGHAESIRKNRRFGLTLPDHLALPMVAIDEVVDTALRWLVRRGWQGVATLPVHGPERLSFRNAATILQTVLSRPVGYEEVPAAAYVQRLTSLGASAEYARGQMEMLNEFVEAPRPAESELLVYSMSTTLRTWATKELLPCFSGTAASPVPDLVSLPDC